jgi:tetratricopeptide (TPR) repeat protein/predicted Ser/Thr protein kinase
MIGQLLSHYRIERELGRGGMGVVYLAFDERLQRRVALKLLLPSSVDRPDRPRRFEREALSAAAVNHPNIVHIYEVGEHEGACFLAMEYVEGESLRQRIARGPLPVPEIRRLGAQMADALRAAHQAGILHRDIKPENILLTAQGDAKLMDFGLARLQKPDGPISDDTITLLTMHGQVVGTPNYMSPEQALGRDIDARSDLFSLGAVLYEMATGKPAFAARSVFETMERVVRIQPVMPPIGDLATVIGRCLAKNRDQRYASASALWQELRSDGSSAFTPHLPLPEFPSVPAPATTVVSTRRRWLAGAALGTTAVVGGTIYWRQRPEPIRSLAVLPFSGPPELDYLNEGMAELMVADLTQLSSIRVVPLSVARRAVKPGLSPSAIGAALGADAVLRGELSARTGGFDLRVQLFLSNRGSVAWSGRHQGSAKQPELVLAEVLQQLVPRLSPEGRVVAGGGPRITSDAYRLYVKGRYHLDLRSLDDLKAAAGLFQQSIERDRNYAPAYAGLANAYTLLTVYGSQAPTAFLKQALQMAHQAVLLDGRNAEALISRAFARTISLYEWAEAEQDYRQALTIDPENAGAHRWLGASVLAPQGRHEEALIELQRAVDLEPSPVNRTMLATGHYFARRYDRAIQALRSVEPLFASLPQAATTMALALLASKRAPEAVALLEALPGSRDPAAHAAPFLAYAWIVAGRAAAGAQLARAIDEGAQYVFLSPVSRSYTWLALGQTGRALGLMEEGIGLRDVQSIFLKADTRSDGLLSLPRFRAALFRMRLDR